MTLILYDLCGRDPDLRFSPFCWRIKMALAHKGLDVRTVATPFTQIQSIEGADAKTVPVLEDDGVFIRGSFEIGTYLDDKFPDQPSLFDGPSARAGGRFLDQWAIRSLHPVIAQMILTDIHGELADADQTYFRESRELRFKKPLEEVYQGVEALAGDFQRALAPLRITLSEWKWAGGPEPRFSDYIIFGPMMWLYTISGLMPLRPDDPVADWFQRGLELHGGMAGSAKRAA